MQTIGEYFVEKCLTTPLFDSPWPHLMVGKCLPSDDFARLQSQCQSLVDMKIDPDVYYSIEPRNLIDYGIDFHDEIDDIERCFHRYRRELCGVFPVVRSAKHISILTRINVCPPHPYRFPIHDESPKKILSAITYICPESNSGTRLFKSNDEDVLDREIDWSPNAGFIFCGITGKTWHSYHSRSCENRVTLNLFMISEQYSKLTRNIKSKIRNPFKQRVKET